MFSRALRTFSFFDFDRYQGDFGWFEPNFGVVDERKMANSESENAKFLSLEQRT